jgi:ABC-2 type transport system permease protein
MNQLPVFFGAVAYEFRMQIRRRAVWITMILLILLIAFALSRSTGNFNVFLGLNSYPLQTIIANWTGIINAILPIGVGVLLADRLPRDRRMRVDELFTSMPGALSSRLLGKYMGSILATLVPMFAFYCIGIGYIFSQIQQPQVLLLAVETFTAIVLPGILFISAFSIACPAILWVPLYQFLFVGYWFWGNWLGAGTGIPTLSYTILTPVGTYISSGFFGDSLFPIQNATVWQGIESMLLLLGIAVFVMVVLWSYLKWQQSRQ